MLEVILVICALAGVSAAAITRRYLSMKGGTERDILSRCVQYLERPEYAVERDVLLSTYKEKIEEVYTGQTPKVSSKSKNTETSIQQPDTITDLKDKVSLQDKVVKGKVVQDTTNVNTKDSDAVNEEEDLETIMADVKKALSKLEKTEDI